MTKSVKDYDLDTYMVMASLVLNLNSMMAEEKIDWNKIYEPAIGVDWVLDKVRDLTKRNDYDMVAYVCVENKNKSSEYYDGLKKLMIEFTKFLIKNDLDVCKGYIYDSSVILTVDTSRNRFEYLCLPLIRKQGNVDA